MTTLLAIDPGMATGLFWGEFDGMTPLRRVGYAQIPGGVEGLNEWIGAREENANVIALAEVIAVEKFTARPHARQWKMDELEPIRIEGYLYGMWGHRINWQHPAAMVLKGAADTQAGRKRASDDVLRRNGWWLTAKDTGLKDANDANAAAKHALAYMRSIGHMPTVDTYLR